MSRREDFNDGYAKCIADIAREIDAIEQDGGSAERAVRNIKAIFVAGGASTWLSDDNVALLRATGKLDDIESVEGKKAAAKLLLEGNLKPYAPHENLINVIPDVVIQDNRIGTPNEPAIAAPLQTRDYSVMIRRTIKAFVSSTFEAASAEQAIEMARNTEWTDEQKDYELDDLGSIEWVHAERSDIDDDEPSDHCDWEPPLLSAGVLVKALNLIIAEHEAFTNNEKPTAIKLANLANRMRSLASQALAEAIPGDA